MNGEHNRHAIRPVPQTTLGILLHKWRNRSIRRHLTQNRPHHIGLLRRGTSITRGQILRRRTNRKYHLWHLVIAPVLHHGVDIAPIGTILRVTNTIAGNIRPKHEIHIIANPTPQITALTTSQINKRLATAPKATTQKQLLLDIPSVEITEPTHH